MNLCSHSVKPYGSFIYMPTHQEISKLKLWQCQICKRWFSLLPEHEQISVFKDILTKAVMKKRTNNALAPEQNPQETLA